MGLYFYGNALIHKSRNKALASIREDADFVLFLDDDMVPEPDALVRFMEHGVPVVSAACTTRVPPVQLAAKVYNEALDQFVPLDALRPGKLISGPFAVGTAFVLIDRRTVELLREYHLSGQDWLDENTRLLNRLHVRSEKREQERARIEGLRRAHWERERMLRIFDFPVSEGELQLGEDMAFARRLLKLGIPVAIDTEVAVGHLGEHMFGVWDLNYEGVTQ